MNKILDFLRVFLLCALFGAALPAAASADKAPDLLVRDVTNEVLEIVRADARKLEVLDRGGGGRIDFAAERRGRLFVEIFVHALLAAVADLVTALFEVEVAHEGVAVERGLVQRALSAGQYRTCLLYTSPSPRD